MLYSQRAWDQREREGRAESAYSAARSESPSEYSRRAWDSTASLDEDLIQSRPESFAPSTKTRDQLGESTYDSMDTISSGDQHAIDSGASQLQRGMSVLGPKTRFVTRAPWEPGGEDDVQEDEEQDTPEAETRSLFGGRGRPKKSKEFPKVRQFPASFAPRASSSSRPSVDVSTPTSSSSGGRVRQTGRPGSAGTSHSNGSEALPFPSPRYERPVAASPRHVYRDIPEQEPASHPYANPDNSSIYEERTSMNEPMSPSSGYPPFSPLATKPPSSDHTSHVSHLSPSAPSREIPRTPTMPQQREVPQKMAPWQFTPSSPTFQLVSLEEAQALKARQRQMSLGPAEPAPRMRTVSGPNRKSMLPVEHANATGNPEESNPGKTLKGRRSLMGLFARGKESRSRPDSPPPPPVPMLSHQASPVSGNTSPLPTMPTPTTATPLRQETHPQPKAPRRIPPPALNVVVTSPQPQSRRQDSEPLGPPPAIPLIQKSATPPPSFPSRAPVRKQNSAATLSPTEGLSQGKPSSAPSSVQGFTGLSLRPVSTMFSSMPVNYLSNSTPVPPAPSFMSMSNSAGQFSTQSPTTPSLWSSRSESMSTGSSEMPPFTPGGLLQSTSSASSMDGGAHSVSILQKQVHASRDIWKGHIADLEAQIRALKAEVADLRQSPCPSCGSYAEKTSVVNRPRPKTAADTNRTLFGNGN